MIRTQVYLTKQQKDKITRLAATEGKLQAEVIRKVVTLGLQTLAHRDTSGFSAIRSLINKSEAVKVEPKMKQKAKPKEEPKRGRGRPRNEN